MKKGGVLNSEIAKVLDDLGHTDQIVICDCGLPIPKGIKKIDISLKKNVPSLEQVFHIIQENMVIEKVIYASEANDLNKEFVTMIKKTNFEIETCSHEEFKKLTQNSIAIIRTGEANPYANVIIQAGVDFEEIL